MGAMYRVYKGVFWNELGFGLVFSKKEKEALHFFAI